MKVTPVDGKDELRLVLGHGDILVMDGGFDLSLCLLHCTSTFPHDVHVAGNSMNSSGRGTSLSTSGVRRSAVGPSWTPVKHVETWAGLLCNQGPRIFREVRTGCAVRWLEPPGPGRIFRNMLGWSHEEETA